MTCKDYEMYQKVELMANFLRKRRQTEDDPGKCKFCGCEMPFAYLVFDLVNCKRYECKLGTKEAARAKEIINGKSGGSSDGKPFPDVIAYPITMCDAMIVRDEKGNDVVYDRAKQLLKQQYGQRTQRPKPKKQEFVTAANW